MKKTIILSTNSSQIQLPGKKSLKKFKNFNTEQENLTTSSLKAALLSDSVTPFWENDILMLSFKALKATKVEVIPMVNEKQSEKIDKLLKEEDSTSLATILYHVGGTKKEIKLMLKNLKLTLTKLD